eukprot:1150230-Pelagomonas_calceolata.AAC.4
MRALAARGMFWSKQMASVSVEAVVEVREVSGAEASQQRVHSVKPACLAAELILGLWGLQQ